MEVGGGNRLSVSFGYKGDIIQLGPGPRSVDPCLGCGLLSDLNKFEWLGFDKWELKGVFGEISDT